MADFNALLEKGSQLAQKAAQGANVLVNLGKEKATLFALQQKLEVLQRKLGALMYAMAKSGKSNGELVQKYIDQMDDIEIQIADLKGDFSTEEDVLLCENCGTLLAPGAEYCTTCGEKVE